MAKYKIFSFDLKSDEDAEIISGKLDTIVNGWFAYMDENCPGYEVVQMSTSSHLHVEPAYANGSLTDTNPSILTYMQVRLLCRGVPKDFDYEYPVL